MKANTTTKSTDNKNVAVCFYRVSTSKQENDRQFADVRKYCDAYSYTIVKEFQETVSGAAELKERKELQEFIKYVETNPVEFVVVSELSRVGRSNLTLQIIEKLTKLKICFVSLKEGLRTLNEDKSINPTTQLIIDILNGINKFELETIRYRVRSGLNKTVATGTWSGGNAPFGYDIQDKRLVISQKEALTVVNMFQLYSEGWGTHKIASHLNTQNIPTKEGKQWVDSKVYKILSNSVYIGKRIWNKEPIEQPELRLIEDAIFTVVQDRLRKNSNTTTINKHNKYDYLLAGKISCSCGQHFVGQKDERYICKSNKYAGGCKVKQVNKEWIEKQVKQELFINYGSLLNDNKKIIDNTASLEAELSEIAAKITKEKIHQNYLINNLSRIGEQRFSEKFDASKSYLKILESKTDEINLKLKATQQFSKLIAPLGMKISSSSVVPVIGTGELNIDKDLLQAAIERIDIDNESIKVSLVNGNCFNLQRVLINRGRQSNK